MSTVVRFAPTSFFRTWIAGLLGAAALVGRGECSDTLVFTDGNFGAGLVSSKIVDTTPGASATFTSSTMPGGVPGAYRDTSHTFNGGTIVVAHFDPQFVETPSSQAICKLDFAADLIHFTGATIGGAVAYQLGLFQGGSYYGGPTINVFANLWASYIQPGLTAADFNLIAGSGPSHPDFSCSGSSIQFGFLSGNSAGSGGPFTKVSGIDNWSVTLYLAKATFTDPTLLAANWTSTKIVDTTPGASATTTSTSQPTGGSPGPYRETSHTWSNGAIVVAHANALALQDPSMEPVYSVDFSADLIHITAGSVGGAVAVRAAVLQGSAWYGGPTINVFSGVWATYAQSALTANDFVLVAGAGSPHPDFTNAGAILQFGYLTANSASGGPVTKIIGVDNWTVTAILAAPCVGPIGTAACFGDDLGNPCPCYPSVPLGSAGRGCANSIEPRGALLVAFGNASIANDTVLFQATGMPNSSCLYFQGSTLSSALFGDGKRCAAGATVRLGNETNICNSSQYPGGSEPTVSVKGMITTPGLRHYQVWYRNSASFCTSSTFNLTNSVSVSWGP
jgi:hypothetical protein